jgi:hypothetical protein
MTPCMPCSIAPCRRSRSAASAQRNGPSGMAGTDRQIPLVTAACGTRVARPARTTRLPPGGYGSQLDPRVRPVPGDTRLVGKGPSPVRGSRQLGVEAASTLAGRPRSGAGRCCDLRHGRLARVARRAYGLHVRAHAHRAGGAGRPRAGSWPRASTATSPSQWTSSSSATQCGNSARTWVGKARCLRDLLWRWRTLEFSRAFPLAATAGRDGQPLPTGWK